MCGRGVHVTAVNACLLTACAFLPMQARCYGPNWSNMREESIAVLVLNHITAAAIWYSCAGACKVYTKRLYHVSHGSEKPCETRCSRSKICHRIDVVQKRVHNKSTMKGNADPLLLSSFARLTMHHSSGILRFCPCVLEKKS